MNQYRLLAVAASVVAALGAGAVASSAQSPPEPREPAASVDALAAECARPLPAPSGAAPATFLKLDGIQGESKNHQHLNESPVDQFRFGAAAPGGPRPLVIGKPYDKASPQLLHRLVAGTKIPSLILSQRNAAGVYLRYSLKGVSVLDVEHTGRVAAGVERLCLSFDSGQVEYRTVNADGSLSGVPVKTQF
jgi:type VI protein secretion system component Hcp